ncbi:MAG: SsrA-binding protein [Cytophagales bacterium]
MKFGNVNNHEPKRKRKLLLNKREINQIIKKVSEKKLSQLFHSIYLFQIEGLLKCKSLFVRVRRHTIKEKVLRRGRQIEQLRQDF